MTTVAAASAGERTQNPLRPARLHDIVGQERAKALLRAGIFTAIARREPLDHTLLVGPAGFGKSSFSHALANELSVDCFDLEAPVSFDTLLELRETMQHGDILKIEEIHQQGIMERRGRSSATSPEVLYAVMEDRVLPTQNGLLPFPLITVIGTTTDEGMLPDSFVDRFPLRPRLDRYTHDELRTIAIRARQTLDLRMTHGAVDIIVDACRGVPRVVNNLIRNAINLTPPGGLCNRTIARRVLEVNGIAYDGLTADMQAMLVFLYTKAKRENNSTGEVVYQASVNTIATAIGKSRDSKAISLRVEPYLIEKGYVQVTHGGRRLTDTGIERAESIVARP